MRILFQAQRTAEGRSSVSGLVCPCQHRKLIMLAAYNSLPCFESLLAKGGICEDQSELSLMCRTSCILAGLLLFCFFSWACSRSSSSIESVGWTTSVSVVAMMLAVAVAVKLGGCKRCSNHQKVIPQHTRRSQGSMIRLKSANSLPQATGVCRDASQTWCPFPLSI